MATTPATPTAEQYGISETQTGITIESLTKTETPLVEAVPDQKNATVNEVKYDTRVDLKLTYRGTKLSATNGVITFNNVQYAVDSHEEAGSYNGLKRYNLSAHRFDNFPAAASNSQAPNNSQQPTTNSQAPNNSQQPTT